MGAGDSFEIIKNAEQLASTPLRRDALRIAEAGLKSIDTRRLIKNAVRFDKESGALCFDLHTCSTRETRRTFVVGVGKCAVRAAEALEEVLGDALTGGIVLDVEKPAVCTLKKIECLSGTHPLPSDSNIEYTKRIVALLHNLRQDDLVLIVVSGGGSTLLCMPEEGGTCIEEHTIVRALMRSGATIREINTIRKHMSRARGGWLAHHAYPAQVVSLIISDVPGDDISFVASGPTVKDSTTLADADRILEKYHILRVCNMDHCGLIETPKDEKYFANVKNILLASNAVALRAMAEKAHELGYAPRVVTHTLEGEAREVARKVTAELHKTSAHSVLLYGGETTVAVEGSAGTGGRNQELALAALSDIGPEELVVSIASDGRDNTEFAGAIADYDTKRKSKEKNLDAKTYLNGHNATPFFAKTDDLVVTGITASNVSDLMIAMKGNDTIVHMEEPSNKSKAHVLWMHEIGIGDVPLVGGKNASLGEMIQYLVPKGVRVPSGFVVTAEAYRVFLQEAQLDNFIKKELEGLDTSNLKDLAARAKRIRTAIEKAEFSRELNDAIAGAYAEMERMHGANIDVAVRSSATAEDLPGASFAGEHETYLGIRGIRDVLTAVKSAMASLFTDRAISYRVDKGFDHFQVALSVAVQQMVRSDLGASGVMFTLDTESGFKDIVLINSTWGLGELIVQGKVVPDEFLVCKGTIDSAPSPIIAKKLGTKSSKMIYSAARKGIRPVKVVSVPEAERERFALTDEEVVVLARWGIIIEDHYTRVRGKWTPMDIEWARDGKSGELYIVQARPETIHAERDFSRVTEYVRKSEGEVIVQGVSVGSKIATGKARVILNVKDIGKFQKGEVLVTDMTDPDWEPIMKIASAIVTDKGGRTSHAAIVSRELGIPAVVGTERATRAIKTGEMITVDTSGSDGIVYRGALAFETITHDITSIPEPKTHIMMNIGTPDTAFEKSFLPNKGVGLAREEFIIASTIGVHPMALINMKKQKPALQKQIRARTKGWNDKVQFYIDNLAYGIARIGAAFRPHPVIVRFSDFKTNEYRALLGGDIYEPEEENPMIGWRGASRYYDPKFRDAFRLECRAIKKVRDDMGLVNVIPMVPFCRTPEEGIKTLEIMAEEGLVTRFMAGRTHSKGPHVPVYVMCEIPSNILLADEFLEVFDGMSIGSNDLTQLVLGLDRDSGIVSHVANEKNPAVKKMISEIVTKCKEKNKYIGICGQAPSDHPDFALFLVEAGIESMSLTPDTVVKTTVAVAEKEKTAWQK